MLDDQQLLELMDGAPEPMHVDLDVVVARGRRRLQRRRAGVVGTCLAVAAAAVVAFVVGTGPGHRLASPDVPADRPTLQQTGPVSDGRSGSTTLQVDGSSWNLHVTDDVLTVRPTQPGVASTPVTAGTTGGAAWRVLGARTRTPALVGVVPGRADRIVLAPPSGGSVPRHVVHLAAAEDFTAFVVAFDAPLGDTAPAADVGWALGDSAVTWALGTEGASDLLAVSMAGEGSGALPPYDSLRTGPASPSAGESDVVVSIDLASLRLGTPLVASLQQGTVLDPEHLQTTLSGLDPETAAGWSVADLGDGRSLVWGVLPRGAAQVGLDVTGSARAGVAVSQDVLDRWTSFAVLVDGDPGQVSGLHATFPGTGRSPLRLDR